MKNQIKYLASLALCCVVATGMWSCGGGDNGGGDPTPPLNTRPVKVSIIGTSFNVGNDMTASVPITFTNFEGIAFLTVHTTVNGITQTEKILKAQLSEQYDYVCQAGTDRPNRFSVRFVATGESGQLSEPKTVEIVKSAYQVTVSLGQSSVTPAAGATSVPVVISVSDPSNLDKIAVTRRGMGAEQVSYITDIPSFPHTYDCAVSDSDPDLVSVSFAAVERTTQLRSEPALFEIDRRAGLGFQNVRCISRITGRNNTGAGFPATIATVDNQTDQKYNVGGTDLGIIWEIEPGRYGLFFGDTFGRSFTPNPTTPGPNGGDWRSNVLLFSDDTDLSNGMALCGAAMDPTNKFAREICKGAAGGENTSIPTAAIRVNGVDYVHYMKIRNWANNPPSSWITDYSKVYKSTDNAKTWTQCTTLTFAGESNFGQVGYWCKDGYCYMVGTNSGRLNKPHLARVAEKNFERQSEYEFWNGSAWIKNNESAAAVLIDDIAGELSVAYNEKFGKWIMLYFSGPRYDITFTYADEITGPWAAPQKIVSGWDYAQLYGSYIHPICLNSDKLYFAMSMWFPYNSYLMCADLVKVVD